MKGKKRPLRRQIKKVGIVGCGLMGGGYAELCARNGYQVVVSEASDDVLKKGLAMIESRLSENVSHGQLPEHDKAAILSRINGTTNLVDLSGCDLAIEAVTEDIEVKKQIFSELDKICPDNIVLATNTSVLSVIDIAMATTRPDRVVGIHMNPLYFPIAELVKTLVTSDETLQVAEAFSRSVGKGIVVAKDTPGFVVNRLITPLLLNAIRMVEAGIALKEDIDRLFTEGMGWPLGPLATADMVGLDTLLLGTEALFQELKDTQYSPPVMLKRMVTAGWLGQKTGKGFYDYAQ